MDFAIDHKKLIQGIYEAEQIPVDCSKRSSAPDFGFNILNRASMLYRPVIDEKYLQRGGTKPIWPGGKKFAVCLTHDVDSVSQFSTLQSLRSLKTIRLGHNRTSSRIFRLLGVVLGLFNNLRTLSKADPLHCYEKWLAVENATEMRSTFFFWPGWKHVSIHHPSDCRYELTDHIVFDGQKCSVSEMIREIHHRGWEIGLHPSWHAFKNLDELKRQKQALENALRHRIVSIRQHFLQYDIRITPRIHAAAGFKYDSTLGFNDNIGFRFGTCYPWKLYDMDSGTNMPILEIPLIIQDMALLNPLKGLRLDIPTAFSYIQQITKAVENVGGVLTLLWHPNTVTRPDVWELYANILAYLRRQKCWVAPLAKIGKWWEDKIQTVTKSP